jgi:hypothetical protein
MNNKKYLFIHLFVILIGVILSLNSGTSCCFSYGYGLGDLVYMFPLWGISILYLIIMLFKRKIFFKTLIPALIYGIILCFFIYNLIFNRGSECPCDLFQ